MKEWKCIQVNHHRSIGETIEAWQKNGWNLNTYACASARRPGAEVNHYLLFERDL